MADRNSINHTTEDVKTSSTKTTAQQAPTSTDQSPIQGAVTVGFGILLLAVLAFIIWTGFGLKPLVKTDGISGKPEIQLTVMMISGVLVLLISFGFLASLYALMGKNDPAQALGLPRGSVRAVFSLLLMVLFAILAVFLYNQLSKNTVTTENEIVHTRLTREERDALFKDVPADQIVTVRWYEEFVSVPDPDSPDDSPTPGFRTEVVQLYDVTRVLVTTGPNPESQRFAQQVLTTISTLVVAVAAFYFGTRAVAKAGELAHQSADLAERGRIREDLRKAEEKAEQDQDNLAKANKSKKEIEDKLKALREKLEAEQENEEVQKNQVERANAPANARQEAKLKLEEMRDELEKRLGEVSVDEGRVEKAQKDFDEAKAAYDAADKKARDAQPELDAALKNATSTDTTINDLTAEIEKLENELEDLNPKIEKLQNKSDQSAAAVADFKKQLEALARGETVPKNSETNPDEESEPHPDEAEPPE